jgi:hypothetical protein
MTGENVTALVQDFSVRRRTFEQSLAALPDQAWHGDRDPDAWSALDLVAHVAAWLDEANDRLPRALIGGPAARYDVDAFNAGAVERARAAGWTRARALGAFRRAADRFETIIADLDPAEVADSDQAMRWLHATRDHFAEHAADLDRLVRSEAGA